MDERAEDETAATLPPSERVAFLSKTLTLAETLLNLSAGTASQWHVQYCRRAAHDFHSSVSRILGQMPASDSALLDVRNAASTLGRRLQAQPG